MQMKTGVFHTPFMRPDRTARETFDWSLKVAVESDKAGLSDFMIGEHATQAWESIPNPEIVIGACAPLTKQMRFAPMGHLLPYHEPGSLAIQIGWLSQILEGRYFLGVGRSAYPNDGVLRGHRDWFEGGAPDWTEARARMDESMKIMRKIWEREPFYYEGDYFKGGYPELPESGEDLEAHLLANHEPWGGPDNLEIAITGMTMNSPSMQWAGENGWRPISFFGGSALLKSHWETYARAVEKRGETPHRSQHMVCREILVADTDEEAKRRAIEGGQGNAWRKYLLPIYKAYGIFDGYVEDSGTGMHPSEVDMDFLAEHVWLCGSPETVIRKIERMIELSGGEGFGTFCMVSHDYIDDPEPWIESIHRIATEVVPHVKVPAAVGA
jgi:alkanesulfonate monooxygenase SsuD/methylene tetrahydromethanopterin reductase-like flavin-dependent oxidoreductase (luciferase family)